jgi:hypothetical protein
MRKSRNFMGFSRLSLRRAMSEERDELPRRNVLTVTLSAGRYVAA